MHRNRTELRRGIAPSETHFASNLWRERVQKKNRVVIGLFKTRLQSKGASTENFRERQTDLWHP